MKNNLEIEIINKKERIASLVDWLVLRHAQASIYSPTMYIDLEGVDLCRDGSLSILTLLADTGIPTRRVYLIDVHLLGAQCFGTAGAKQKTLKDILEDEKITKVFFDVRNDSDALYAHFGVRLQGVEDIQLMESATRKTTRSRKFLNGLVKCVEANRFTCLNDNTELAAWKLAKHKGERLFKPEQGGSYEVFTQRPIPEELVSYCAGDVQCLPELRAKFWFRNQGWQDLVNEETKKRVAASQEPEYQPHGADRAVAPWSGDQHKALDQWNYVPPRDYFDEDWVEEDQTEEPEPDDNDYEDWTTADWQGPPS
ncbi:hypothetical protein GQX73_g1637 [Xylaria multiplex]|uniref:3'-5' exonuclease domain-containing protein n=1 Tax=Xylaria multiplex TaxID=323545 RepID=A0A7C8N340_9PEZI|nr:hypothetical protein GQX73_g1637 [Xylaria multiplex]